MWEHTVWGMMEDGESMGWMRRRCGVRDLLGVAELSERRGGRKEVVSRGSSVGIGRGSRERGRVRRERRGEG